MGALDGLEGRYVGLACWSFLFVLFIGVLSLFLFIFSLFCLLRLFRGLSLTVIREKARVTGFGD